MCYNWCPIINRLFSAKKNPWLHQGSALYTMSVGKCVMTSIHHYSVVFFFLSALNFPICYLFTPTSFLVSGPWQSLISFCTYVFHRMSVAVLQYAATSVWFLTCSNVYLRLHLVTANLFLVLNNATCLDGPQFTPPFISWKASRLLSSFINHDERY